MIAGLLGFQQLVSRQHALRLEQLIHAAAGNCQLTRKIDQSVERIDVHTERPTKALAPRTFEPRGALGAVVR